MTDSFFVHFKSHHHHISLQRGMEDSKSINSYAEEEEEDIENGSNSSEVSELVVSNSTSPNSDKIPDRCVSFTQIYRHPVPKTTQDLPAKETLLLAYQSIGIVYGDLGTSPTQVLPSISITNLTEEDLLGILSLIIWCLSLFALVKYVFIVLNADDHGEGGTFALYSKLCRHINLQSKLNLQNTRLESDANVPYSTNRGSPLHVRTKSFLERSSAAQSLLTFVVLLGTFMVIGDGALTPVTCVLSALQGIQLRSSKVTQDQIVIMAVVLFILLFTFQRYGTSKVGFSFSPIMMLWYATNVSIGIYNIFRYQPSILKAISPHYMFTFFFKNGTTAWQVIGAVFLCISGVEALFADLGHFNKKAIQMAFSFIVYPSMVFTYAGEVAYLVKHNDQISNAYYSSIPESVYWPMFVLSTFAALVSSQSMISATFSIVKQSTDIDCFPRVQIIHTSSKYTGQIYCPEINYTLMILSVGLVVGFQGGIELANAYGAVVIWVMIITTCLTTLVMLIVWKTNIILIVGFFLFYIVTEIVLLSSLLNKIPQGGWVPIAISCFFLTVMLSWKYGRNKKNIYEAERQMSLDELGQILSSGTMYRTPGVCFFCTDLVNGIPPIIRQYIKHTNSVHEIMVLLTVRTTTIKNVPPEERLIVGKLGNDGVYRCLVQYGYKEPMSVEGGEFVNSVIEKVKEQTENVEMKQKLDAAAEKGFVFVIGRTILKSNKKNRWLARFTVNYLYRFLQKNCTSQVSELKIPQGKTLQVGMVYEI